MNRKPATNEIDAALDRLLEAHLADPSGQVTPSSGFALSVMDAIHQRAIEPPPLPFPWRRVLPGAIALLCTLAAFLVFVLSHPAAPQPHLLPALSTFTHIELILASAFLAACLSITTIAASFRIAGRSR
jgi:hypothetical protein